MEPLQYQDVSLKAQRYELLSVENRLRALGARFAGVDVQTDTYFEVDEGRLMWRKGNVENFITHFVRTEDEAGVETTRVFRFELDPSEEELTELRRDHRTKVEVHKTRQIFWIGSVKVHLDTLPTGEYYVEIEAMAKGKKVPYAELHRQAHGLREKLGIGVEELVPFDYYEEEE